MALHDAQMDEKDEKEMLDVMRNKNEAYIPPKEPVKEPEKDTKDFGATI